MSFKNPTSSAMPLPPSVCNYWPESPFASHADRRRPCIVIDTREQRPLDFSAFKDVRTVVRKCWPGDYSLEGAPRLFAVERKSVADLVNTMLDGYAGFSATSPKRFDATLLGLRGIIALGGIAFVLVEPDGAAPANGGALAQIRSGGYKSTISPDKVLSFVSSIKSAWQIPVHFADSREHAAAIVHAAAVLAHALKRGWRGRTDARNFGDSLGQTVVS